MEFYKKNAVSNLRPSSKRNVNILSFTLSIDNHQAVQAALSELNLFIRPEHFSPRDHVQTSMPLWSVYSSFNKARIAPAEWGMLPNWDTKRRITRPLTVARVETLYDRVSYKNLIPRYRALIPVNAFIVRSNSRTVSAVYKFYKAQDTKQPCIMLAALYQFNVDGNMQVVLLSQNKKASEAHRSVRMPLIIHKENWATWLNTQKKDKIDQLLESSFPQNLVFTNN